MSQPEDLLFVEVTDDGLRVAGEIDAHTAPRLAAALDASGSSIRLDLSGVEFVDSSGLRVLIDAHQRLDEAGGALRLVSPSDPVRRLLEISGVDGYLTVSDD